MKRFLFLDLETTGLNPDTCSIIEIGAVVTDDKFNELNRFSATIGWGNRRIRWEPEAAEMHASWYNQADKMPLKEALVKLKEFLQMHRPVPGKYTLAGRNPAFDRSFLNPEICRVLEIGPIVSLDLSRFAGHRNFDLCSLDILADLLAPAVSRYTYTKPHRALPDCLEAIEAAKYYVNLLRFDDCYQYG